MWVPGKLFDGIIHLVYVLTHDEDVLFQKQ